MRKSDTFDNLWALFYRARPDGSFPKSLCKQRTIDGGDHFFPPKIVAGVLENAFKIVEVGDYAASNDDEGTAAKSALLGAA